MAGLQILVQHLATATPAPRVSTANAPPAMDRERLEMERRGARSITDGKPKIEVAGDEMTCARVQ